MDRRQSLQAAAGILAATSLSLGSKALAKGHSSKNLHEALSHCIEKGEVCVEHCIVQLGKGDKSFVKCLREVREMLAVCKATESLVRLGDKEHKRLHAACKTYCKECMDACLEHKSHWTHKMHLECKECHDSCKALLKHLG